MLNSNLITLLAETDLSPEALAEKVGLSGMTLRRWLLKPESESIGEPYASAFHSAIQRMVTEGSLDIASKSAQWSFAISSTLSHQAALKSLGFEGEMTPNFAGQEEQVLSMLGQIGSREKSRQEVDSRREAVSAFGRYGQLWSTRISFLTGVLDSNRFGAKRFIAYGALFYLLFPFDLIPDVIPAFGFVDDLAILGLAVHFYQSDEKSTPKNEPLSGEKDRD